MSQPRGSLRKRRARLACAVVALSGVASFVPAVLAAPSAAAAFVRLPSAQLTVPAGARLVAPLETSRAVQGDVALAPSDPSALNGFVAGVSTPGSPTYRHFLTPGQFGPRFGASPATLASVRSWLANAGLVVTGTDPDDLFVGFSGSVGTVASAFGVSMARYRLGSTTGYAATGTPLVPASLRTQVRAIIGLSDLDRLRPHLVRDPAPSTTGGGAGGSAATPHVAGSGPAACNTAVTEASATHGYTSPQLADAYGLNSLYAQGLLGAGTTVGIFELEPYQSSDIAAFQSCYGTNTSVSEVPVDGGAGAGAGSGESALDIEQVIGLAPASSIVVYEGPPVAQATQQNVYDVYKKIADDDQAQVVSTSWGLCEDYMSPPSWILAQAAVFEQMAAQGQSMLAASGDEGAEDCYTGADSAPGINPWVDNPGSQPYVTGVGGTSVSDLSPLTEWTWNDCQSAMSISCAATSGTGASGGGISAAWDMPAWQSGNGVTSGFSSGAPCGNRSGDCREVPDVAASGDPSHGIVIVWNGSWQSVGGTSAAVVVWASVVALVDEAIAPGTADCASASPCARGLGLLNPVLYRSAPCPARPFNDVTVGTNDFTDNPDGAYPARAGYDMATGWGSPNAPGLLTAVQAGGCSSGVVSSGSGLPTISVQGPDNSLWVYWQAGDANWHGPLGVGGPGSDLSSPSIAIGSNGLPTISVQGPDNSLWVYWQAGDASWHGPLGVGGPGSDLSAPSMAVDA